MNAGAAFGGLALSGEDGRFGGARKVQGMAAMRRNSAVSGGSELLCKQSSIYFLCERLSPEPFSSARVTAARQNLKKRQPGTFRYANFTPDVLLMAVILVVDDEIFIRQNAEWVIEDMGHNTLAASDLSGALLHLVAPHHIDALFVDILLAALVFGGYDVANQAIVLRPDLPVLYTSGSSLTDDMTGRFVPGGRFLQKPYSSAQLGSFLGELLH